MQMALRDFPDPIAAVDVAENYPKLLIDFENDPFELTNIVDRAEYVAITCKAYLKS